MHHTHLNIWVTDNFLCMYTPSQSRQPAILHCDECYIHKQNECLMIQQGHTILVLECETWKIRFLCWDICLCMHCTVLIDCTETTAFVCAHFNWYSHSPSFQASANCIHHLQRNFGLDQEFLVEIMFYLFLAQVLPEFHQPSLIHEQFESNIHSHQIVLIHTLVTTCQCQYLKLLSIWSSFQFLPHCIMQLF